MKLHTHKINKPVKVFNLDNTTTEPDSVRDKRWAEEVRRESAYQVWLVERGIVEDPDDYTKHEEVSSQFGVEWKMQELRNALPDHVVASTIPYWNINLEDWLMYDDTHYQPGGVLGSSDSAASVTIPFALPSKGVLSVRYETYQTRDRKDGVLGEVKNFLERKSQIIAKSGDGVYRGSINREFVGEMMTAYFVVLKGAPQQLADDIATIYGEIAQADITNDLSVYLAPFNRCVACSRPLKDVISKAIGYGPDCARKWRIAHTVAAADSIVRRRAEHQAKLAAMAEQADIPDWLKSGGAA
jgi:hypothetical protein